MLILLSLCVLVKGGCPGQDADWLKAAQLEISLLKRELLKMKRELRQCQGVLEEYLEESENRRNQMWYWGYSRWGDSYTRYEQQRDT